MPIHHLSKTWPRFMACSAIFAGASLGPAGLGDLTQATQKAIALIILKVAQDKQTVSAEEAKQLKKLGKNGKNDRSSVGEDILASDNAGIATEESIAIFSPGGHFIINRLLWWKSTLSNWDEQAQETIAIYGICGVKFLLCRDLNIVMCQKARSLPFQNPQEV